MTTLNNVCTPAAFAAALAPAEQSAPAVFKPVELHEGERRVQDGASDPEVVKAAIRTAVVANSEDPVLVSETAEMIRARHGWDPSYVQNLPACNNVYCGSVPDDIREARIFSILSELYILKGLTNRDSLAIETKACAHELNEVIRVRYPYFTLNEIRYALVKGVEGVWTPDDKDSIEWVSITNYCAWLAAYRDLRKSVADALAAGARIATPALPPATAAAYRLESCKRALQTYRDSIEENGTIKGCYHFNEDGIASDVYSYLRDQGTMPAPSRETVAAAMQRAASEGCVDNKARDWRHNPCVLRARFYILEDFLRAS